MSCAVDCRLGSDPALLWLWCRPAAIAPIRLLAWEPPYAVGSGPRKDKKTKRQQQQQQQKKGLKLIKLEMKKEKLQWTSQKYKGS